MQTRKKCVSSFKQCYNEDRKTGDMGVTGPTPTPDKAAIVELLTTLKISAYPIP